MGDCEERDTVKVDPLDPGTCIEDRVEQQVAAFVRAKADGGTGNEQPNRCSSLRT
jgi:hypothetical protein